MSQHALDAGDVPGYAVVPSDDYPTIQAAHDALPSSGGGIWLAGSVEETDIVIEKPVKIVGQGTEFDTGDDDPGRPVDAEPLVGPGATIDTSGGDGIHLKATGAVLQDVQIVGDYTGGYGLKVDGTACRGSMTFENVLVARKGGHGVVLTGGQLNNKFDVVVWDCAGDGWRFRCDWFNEHLFERMVAYSCEGNGVTIEQSMDPDNPDGQRSRFNGNSIQQFWMEVNEGYGLYVEDDVRFEGNHISGYGIEHNQGPGDQPNEVIKVTNLRRPDWREGPSGNMLHVRNLLAGDVEIDREEFETFIVTNLVTEAGRVEVLGGDG